MQGIEFVASFNHDSFIRSANAMLNSFRNMAAQVERMGGNMQNVMDGIFDGTNLGRGMQSFFDGIIENFGLSEAAAESFRQKAEESIKAIGSSSEDAATKINKIVTSIAQLASEAKQADMSGMNDHGAGSRTLEDMRVSASFLIETLNEAVEASDNLGESISKTNGKTYDDVRNGIENYGNSLKDARKAAEDANQAQEEYIKGLEEELARITEQINATSDKTILSQLNQEAQELTIDLNSANVILKQIESVKEGLDVKITEYDAVRQTTSAFEDLNNKLKEYGRILGEVKFGTEESTKAFEEYANKTSSVSDEIKGSLKSLAAMAGIAFGVHEIGGFIQNAAQVRKEFQDIESSMKVFLGNEEKATEFVEKLKDYAWYNMFEFKDLTKASQQMIAYGQDVDTIIPKLDMLSNVAAGTHAPLMEMVDAYNRAKSTGVVDAQGIKSWAVKGVVIKDVLKEMGEAASGTQITFEQLNKVLEHITGEGGMFHNLMAEQLNNISAEKGQLEDNLTNMFNDIGERLQGVIIKWYKLQSDMVDNYTDIAGGDGTIDFVVNFAETGMDLLMEHWKELLALIKNAIVLYGSWRVAIAATNSVHKAHIALLAAEETATIQNTIATKADIAAKGMATKWTVLLDKAVKAFNASMLASPWTWAAAAIAGLTFAIYKLVTAETAAEAGIRQANERLQKQTDLLNERKDNISNLINTIKDENQTAYAQLEAYKKLKAIAPEIADAYTQQQIAAMGADEEMKLLNKDMEDMQYEQAKKNVDEYTKKVEGLKITIENYLNSPTQQMGDKNGMVYSSYLKALEESESQLKVLKDNLAEMESLRKEAYTPIEVKIKEDQTNANEKQKVLDFYDEAMRLAQNVADADDSLTNLVEENAETNYYVAVKQFDEFIARVKADLEDPYNIKYGNDKTQTQQFYNELLDLKSKWQGVFNSPIDVLFRMKWQDAKNQAEESHGTARDGYHWEKSTMFGWIEVKNAQAETARNREEIQKQLRKVQSDIDKMTPAAAKADKALANGLSAQRKKLQEELKAYSDTSKDEAKTAKDRATRNAKERQEQWKHEEEMTKITTDAIRARENAAIAAIENQAVRERKERETQHKRTIQDLRKQEDDIYKAIYDQRKKQWELEHKDSPYENTEQGTKGWKGVQGTLTEEEKKYFDERKSIITSNLEKENAEWSRYLEERRKQEQQYLTDYIKEYGSIQQQREAITLEYDQKIADEGNAVQKAALEQQKQRLLSDLNFKEMQQSIDWEAVFNDLERQSTSSLRSLKKKLEQALDARDIMVENVKILAEKIRETEDIIARRTDMWSSWIPGLRERQRRSLEISEIDKKIRGLQTAGDTATVRQEDALKAFTSIIGIDPESLKQQFGDINADSLKVMESFYNIDTSSQAVRDAFALLQTSTIDLSESQEQLRQAQKDRETRRDALSNFTKGGSISQYFKDVTAGMDFTGYVGLINQNAQSMADFVDKIGAGETEFGKSVHDFAEGVNGFMSAIQSLASGDVFGAINGVIDGIVGLGNALGRPFGLGGADYTSYEGMVEKYNGLIKVWDELIDRKQKYLNISYGSEALKAQGEIEKLYQKEVEAYRELGKERLNAGASTGSSSIGKRMSKSMSYQDWQEIAKALGWSVEKAQDFIGTTRMTGLFDLTAEQLKKIQENAQVFWAHMDDDVRQYLESIIKADEALQDSLNVAAEQITQTSFDSVFDSFMTSLNDFADGSKTVFEDVAENWQKMMNKMVLYNLVGEKYKTELKKWYEQWNSIYKGKGDTITKEEIESLRTQYNALLKDATDEVKSLREQGIIKRVDEAVGQQSATAEAMQRITVDQADELIGRMNAGQMIWQIGNNQRDMILQNIATMNDIVAGGGRSLGEMVTLMQTANGHLATIVSYNKKMYNDFGNQIAEMTKQIKESRYA